MQSVRGLCLIMIIIIIVIIITIIIFFLFATISLAFVYNLFNKLEIYNGHLIVSSCSIHFLVTSQNPNGGPHHLLLGRLFRHPIVSSAVIFHSTVPHSTLWENLFGFFFKDFCGKNLPSKWNMATHGWHVIIVLKFLNLKMKIYFL